MVVKAPPTFPSKRSRQITRYAYNNYGLLNSVVDAIGGETRYGYDLMGRKRAVDPRVASSGR
jgi:YD repeat-containing protein